ncbi:hypothetical protein D3227_29250 [Mesorhizobium waimense]|uniref:Uncharacterized protein n=1 Tax=Mesorhizobium waimense TaxID=1300307 RepID=A0A3A5K709_9HYPH|nr:hypothetical protein D3227_29250 [Mesorhizobium waimense]
MRKRSNEHTNQAIATKIRESEPTPRCKIRLRTVMGLCPYVADAILHQCSKHSPSPFAVSEPPPYLLDLLL